MKIQNAAARKCRTPPPTLLEISLTERAAVRNAAVVESGAFMKTKLSCLIVLLLASTGPLFAQSGRKSTGSSSSTTTTTTTTPSVSGTKTTEKKTVTPKLQLLVGIDRRDAFSNVPYYLYDTVLD